MKDGNVVDFIKHAQELRKEQNDPGYIPEDEDIEAFLKVLDFLRTLSTSNDGRIDFDGESLRVILVSVVAEEDLGEDGLVTKKTALHQEVEMDFPNITNSASNDEEENLIAAVEDFNDGMYGLAQMFSDNDKEEKE